MAHLQPAHVLPRPVDPAEGPLTPLGWELLNRCRDPDAAASAAALEGLCRFLRPTVLAYVRARCACEEDAEDLTQDFFVRAVVTENHLLRADPARGTFRSFLFTVLQRHLNHGRQRSRAAKRGGAVGFVALEEAGVEEGCPALPEAVRRRQEEAHLDRRWAAALFTRVRGRLAVNEALQPRTDQVVILLAFLHEEGEAVAGAGPGYAGPEEVARGLGLSVPAFKSALHRLRGRYRSLLREAVVPSAVAGSVVDPADLIHLCAAWVANAAELLG